MRRIISHSKGTIAQQSYKRVATAQYCNDHTIPLQRKIVYQKLQSHHTVATFV